MPKTVRGVFRNGEIALLEEPDGIERARVLVTFLTDADVEDFAIVGVETVKNRRTEILQLAEKHGARNVRVVGSVARGEADAASDVDLLVDLEPERDLFDIIRLKRELGTLLGCPVDVGTEAGLRESIRERVLQEAMPL